MKQKQSTVVCEEMTADESQRKHIMIRSLKISNSKIHWKVILFVVKVIQTGSKKAHSAAYMYFRDVLKFWPLGLVCRFVQKPKNVLYNWPLNSLTKLFYIEGYTNTTFIFLFLGEEVKQQ